MPAVLGNEVWRYAPLTQPIERRFRVTCILPDGRERVVGDALGEKLVRLYLRTWPTDNPCWLVAQEIEPVVKPRGERIESRRLFLPSEYTATRPAPQIEDLHCRMVLGWEGGAE